MRIRWRDLELPNRVAVDRETLTPTYGKFYAEPFERGYGVTVGNSLRRVLLSSLEGSAVTSVKIDGVSHEFSTIKGVYEEVPEIVLNIKKLLVKVNSDEPRTLTLKKAKKGEVTAADLEGDAAIEIVNKNLHICTLVEDVEFSCQLTVRKGRGYITADENTGAEQEIGVIPVDSVFTPVLRVRYKVEDARVGKKTNYDRLVLEVWTDGTVSPELAVVEASKILRKHLNPFVQYFDLRSSLPQDEVREDKETQREKYIADLRKKLEMDVSALDLSVRAQNCIEAERIRSIGDLVRYSEADLLRMRNFGKTSLKEIKKKLGDMELSLGMDLDMILAQKN